MLLSRGAVSPQARTASSPLAVWLRRWFVWRRQRLSCEMASLRVYVLRPRCAASSAAQMLCGISARIRAASAPRSCGAASPLVRVVSSAALLRCGTSAPIRDMATKVADSAWIRCTGVVLMLNTAAMSRPRRYASALWCERCYTQDAKCVPERDTGIAGRKRRSIAAIAYSGRAAGT